LSRWGKKYFVNRWDRANRVTRRVTEFQLKRGGEGPVKCSVGVRVPNGDYDKRDRGEGEDVTAEIKENGFCWERNIERIRSTQGRVLRGRSLKFKAGHR